MAGFHSRTVPSEPALASSLPSGLNATPYTPALGPVTAGRGVPEGWRVTVFHSRSVPEEPTVAISLPSGLNATGSFKPFCTLVAGSMPSCRCSASKVVMADRA